MMDIIILNRISTNNKDQGPKSNLTSCEFFCKENNLNKIKVLIDEGISGLIPYYNRPNAKKIDNYIKKYKKLKKPLGIVVFSIDRFSREHPLKVFNTLSNLKKDGVKVFSATEDMFNTESDFTFPMQSHILWFNYYMLIQHSKKVKAGNKTRKAKGLHLGRALTKRIEGTGKNKKHIYYTKDELNSLHTKIKELSKKLSYNEIRQTLRNEEVPIKVSKSYIGKIVNEKR